MSECIAYDDDGSIMTLYTLNTIAPTHYSNEARALALFHLKNVDNTSDSDVNGMLPDQLYDIDTGEQTHIMCSRPGYDNTIRSQYATMLAENLNGGNFVSDIYFYLSDKPDIDTIKSKMCLVIGDRLELLRYLGLEVK